MASDEGDGMIHKVTDGMGSVMEAAIASLNKKALGEGMEPGGAPITGPAEVAGAMDPVAQAKGRIENAMDIGSLNQVVSTLPPEIKAQLQETIAAKTSSFQQAAQPAPAPNVAPAAVPAPAPTAQASSNRLMDAVLAALKK